MNNRSFEYKNSPFYWIMTLLGSFVMLFILAPLIGMFLATTPVQVTEAVSDPVVAESIILTLLTAMGAALLFAIPAIPLAYILARRDFFLKGLLLAAIDLPIVIPHTAAGIALLGSISRNSIAGRIAESLGLSLVGNPAGIILAMAFVSLPFLVKAAYTGFCAVPERLEKAALTLGASPAKVFFSITLPLARRSILSGLILMWARGMSEFGAVIIVAYHPMITPVLIFERFSAYGLKYARPVAVGFIIICLILFALLQLSRKKQNHD